jgi:Rieske Fe-S protein
VGFAVGIACILVGLVVSWPAAAVGAVIAFVFGALWIRDATAGYRAPVHVEPEARVAAPAVPATAGEAGAPEPEPGERYPRSVFLEASTLGLGAVIGGIVTVPALGFMVLPAFLHQKSHTVDVGPLTDFPQGQYVVTTFLSNPSEGEVSRRTAYVRNNGLLRGLPSFTIISNRCAHLGCPVQPNGPLFSDRQKVLKSASNQVTLIPAQPAGFGCPCHGGQYDTEGNRTAGPPVRALDRYEYSIDNGHLVLGRTYSVAHVTGQGAGARIKRYNLAGPGEHVDGPEAWLYPLNPPH